MRTLIIFITISTLVIVTGVWKITAPWIIEKATSFSQITLPVFLPFTPTPAKNSKLEYCHVNGAELLSTPQLIGCAFLTGKITDEQRILYLAYSIYDHEKLPLKYQGTKGWEGTSVVDELNDVIFSTEQFCTFSKDTQDKLRNLFPKAVQCL